MSHLVGDLKVVSVTLRGNIYVKPEVVYRPHVVTVGDEVSAKVLMSIAANSVGFG